MKLEGLLVRIQGDPRRIYQVHKVEDGKVYTRTAILDDELGRRVPVDMRPHISYTSIVDEYHQEITLLPFEELMALFAEFPYLKGCVCPLLILAAYGTESL